jgi:hypothetical protein
MFDSRGWKLKKPMSQFNPEIVRTFAIFIAGILLNLGLFFVLAIFAPLLVGFILGYVLGHKGKGIISSILSAAVSYLAIFIVTGFGSDLFVLSSAVIIMCIIGGIGGYLGAIIYQRSSTSSLQVSTTIRPGE